MHYGKAYYNSVKVHHRFSSVEHILSLSQPVVVSLGRRQTLLLADYLVSASLCRSQSHQTRTLTVSTVNWHRVFGLQLFLAEIVVSLKYL